MSAASLLRAISPFGPIFGKELRVTARRKRSYWLRVGYLGALLLFMMMVYASTSSMYTSMGVAARNQRLATLGMEFFVCFSMFSILAMGLIGPVLTCTAIGGEKLHKTLPVLLMTPISAWQIVAGKLSSRLLVALTLIGLSLPVLALVRLLGGVELEDMLIVVSVAAAAALGSAAIGLFLSSLTTRAYVAIVGAYAVLFILYFFVPAVVMTLAFNTGVAGPRMAVVQWLSMFNPYFFAIMLVNGRMLMRGASVGWVWFGCIGVQLSLAAVLLAASARIVRRAVQREGTPASKKTRKSAATTSESAEQDASGKAHKNRAIRDVGDNPIIWREVRRPLLATRRQSVIAGVIAVSLIVGWFLVFGRENWVNVFETHTVYAMIYNVFGWLLAAVLAATSIAQEKESDTWTLLLATPVSGKAVVWGKALGVLRRLLWPAVFVALHFLIFAALGMLNFGALVLVVWVVVSFNTLWIATGIYFSLRLKKVTSAVIMNLMLAIGMYVFVPATLQMISGFADADHLAEQVFWYLPYYYLGVGMEGLEHWHKNAGYVHGQYLGNFDLPGMHHQVGGFEFFATVFLVGFLYIFSAALILMYTARRFDALVARAPQRNFLPLSMFLRKPAL